MDGQGPKEEMMTQPKKDPVIDKYMIRARKKFLKLHKLTPRRFAEAVRLDYNTCIRYFEYGRQPMPLYLDRILTVFSDFPHR